MPNISPDLKKKIIALAKKYETKEFILNDPSQFMHNYSKTADQEIVAFITAQFSFGRRDIFIKKLSSFFELIKASSFKTPSAYIKAEHYKKDLPYSEKKFYRFYSYIDLIKLLDVFCQILNQNKTLGEKVQNEYILIEEKTPLSLVESLIKCFPDCKCISQNPKSACKRLHMFLRWMVRQNSPVDLGLWTWADAKDLIIPLDTHVMQQSLALGLLGTDEKGIAYEMSEKRIVCEKSKKRKMPAANFKTAYELTQKMKSIWPNDPSCADFALFGLGVNSE